MNHKFEIEDWLPHFPLKEECGRYSGSDVTSPGGLCTNEQLRQEIVDQVDWGQEVPVDVFVMAEGEPEDRASTKIGGLPYRPRSSPWPIGPLGDPMLFLAQFNFSDSHDIVGKLPGELLLVFGDDSGGMFDPLHFEWQAPGLIDVVTQDDVPPHNSSFIPCYGHIYRTMNYPAAQWRLSPPDSKYPRCRGLEVWHAHSLLQYEGTQIGRAPFFIQRGDEEVEGEILCTIGSVCPPANQRFPWINRPEPIPLNADRYGDHLVFGDSGCIYISIDSDQQLHWRQSSY